MPHNELPDASINIHCAIHNSVTKKQITNPIATGKRVNTMVHFIDDANLDPRIIHNAYARPKMIG